MCVVCVGLCACVNDTPWFFAVHSRWWWASSPGGQRRRTIPRGAQFCSIYLQNHINKCCRIVQLLKSKAAWWGGDAKDERSLQRWWRYRRDAAWNLLHMGGKKKARLFSVSFHTNITVLSLPSIKKDKTIQIKALLLFLCADTVHILSTHICISSE